MEATQRIPRLLATIALTAGLCVGSLLPGKAPPVAAYDGNGAATWADAYWNTCAPSPWTCYTADCANFASVAMHVGGGYPYTYSGWDPSSWWWVDPWTHTPSWTAAPSLFNFLMYDDPGGAIYGITSGANPDPSNSLAKGDLIFFDWTTNNAIDHVSMETGWGSWQSVTDGQWHYGDYLDQHTTNRWHQAWNGYYLNDDRATTTVYQVHVYAGN